MKLAIIGAGNVGRALGEHWTSKGHQVAFGVRDPNKEPAPHGTTRVSIRAAVESSEVVVLATPWNAVDAALAEAGDFGGRVLVDATNPIAPGLTLAVAHGTSGGEYVASKARNARVVKAFNTTGFENMADARYGSHRAVMLIAGDDAKARETVLSLASDLGFDAVSVGALSRSRQLEPLAILFVKLAMQLGHGRGIAFGIMRGHGAEPVVRKKADRSLRIAVVGTGNIGAGLASAWLESGHTVHLAVRDAAAGDVKSLVEKGAKVVAIAGAADAVDVIALAVPFAAAGDVLKQLGTLDGKIVIDCTNAIAPGFQVQFGGNTSSAEELARQAPKARWVRSFNQQGAETLRTPDFDGIRATNFVAGDDADARRTVASLVEAIGLEAVDAGPLASSRSLEAITILWIAASQSIGSRDIGLSLLRRGTN